jgi:Holliday junction resolvase
LRDSKEKFKILKTDDDFHKLAKFVEPFFSKPLLDVSVSAKNTYFCNVTKIRNFYKKKLKIIVIEPKAHLNIFGREKLSVKGLIT